MGFADTEPMKDRSYPLAIILGLMILFAVVIG
jgi:hypothetical protein